MAYDLPLAMYDPNPFASALSRQNALNDSTFKNIINSAKAAYAPTTELANAASKLTYSNLMGPQFLAKLYGNENFLANTPSDQLTQGLNLIQRAGLNSGAGNLTLPNVFNSQNQTSYGYPANQNAVNYNPQVPQERPLNQNAPQTSSSQQTSSSPPLDVTQPTNAQTQPQTYGPSEKYGYDNLPAPPPEFYSNMPSPTPGVTNSFAGNVGQYKGVVAQGQEAGKIRAQQASELDQSVMENQNALDNLNLLAGTVQDPEFSKMRQVPLLGQHELGWYELNGNKKQQKLVGNLYTYSGNVVLSAQKNFKGAFRVGEQELLNTMKVNPGDMPAVAVGKIEAMNNLLRIVSERARLASMYMQKYNMNLGPAKEMADRIIKPEAIKQQIHDQMYPYVTIRNKKTGETKTLPIQEARKLMQGGGA